MPEQKRERAMKKLQLITAKYQGELRTLTISQWAELLQVSKKTLYGRHGGGKTGDDFIYGLRAKTIKREKQKMKELYIKQCYQDFNFSHGIINLWRQKNGIR